MAKFSKDKNPSTLRRFKDVYDIYEDILNDLGDLKYEVSRSYIYAKIHDKTGLCTKTIAYIVNHFPSFRK